MTALKVKLFGIVLIVVVAGFTASKAEVDCSERPPHVDIKSCCELSNILSDEVKETCNMEGGPPEGPHGFHGPPGDHPHGPPGRHKGRPHGPHPCFASCVFNETGILLDDELQEDNLEIYLNQIYDDSEKVEFLTEKFQHCNELRQNFVPKMPHHKHGPPNCGPKHGGMLIGCVFMEAFKDCPDSSWSNTDECNAARDHFNQCFPHGNSDAKEEEDVEEI